MKDVKAYLHRIELYDAHINNKIQEINNLRSLATKITAAMDQVPVSGSGNQDKLGDAVARIVDLQVEVNAKVDAYVDLKRQVGDVLEHLQDADQVKVLHKRYFEYKPWEQIACEMNCSFRNVCYIHGKALQAVGEILERNG